MKATQPRSLGATRRSRCPRLTFALLSMALTMCVVAAPPAGANPGYARDAAHPSRSLPGPPRGIAVDQATGDVYVAIVSTNPLSGGPGQIDRFSSDLSADGAFGDGYYTGVALNPAGGFFGAQMELRGTPLGDLGTPRLDEFDSTGSLASSFPLSFSDSLPPIVTDSSGHIFFPNVNTHSVQVYSSAETLLEELTCSGCPGGSFGKPASVAFDSAGDLYVADTSPDRVVKLAPSGGSYSYSATVQSGQGAGAVAIDPSTGDIFVGDMPGGNDYHIVAYDSSGAQFDDFGAGLFPDSTTGYGALSAYQIGVNGTTHEVYVSEFERFLVFERTVIGPPSVVVEPATEVAQLGAVLNASVNPHGHAVLECEFEYTTEADFEANGFSSASTSPCPGKPDEEKSAHLSVRVMELSPSTEYRYRITATSNGGSTSSGSQQLETLPELPATVTTEPAQAVGQTTATIMATVNPKGGTVTSCRFELGNDSSYGTNLICPTPPGWSSDDVSEARAVSGLSPATTYHYRLVVTTNAGTTEGDDVEFTTASPSPPSEPEPAPVPTPEPAPATSPPPPAPVGPIATRRARRCKRGFRRGRVHGHARCVKACRKRFRRKRVHGTVRCVRRRPTHRRRRHRHHRRAHHRSK
jgi:DNA-binding beta-propeller fold protein YncE